MYKGQYLKFIQKMFVCMFVKVRYESENEINDLMK